MGDRATVLLYGKDNDGYRYSPIIYTHWGGSRVDEVISEVQRFYIENDEDRNMEPSMRQEIERVYPHVIMFMVFGKFEPQTYNFDKSYKHRWKLPTANDLPIVADDRGCFMLNVATLNGVWSSYDWSIDNV